MLRHTFENVFVKPLAHWLFERWSSVAPAALTVLPLQTLTRNEGTLDPFGIVFGVPKKRTSKPKIHNRRFSPFRLMKTASIYECSDCGSILGFSPSTLCLRCYDVIRVKTLEIKRRMMNYNPYIGERQTPQPTYKEEEESKHIESERLKIESIDDENNKSKLIER